MLTFILFTPNIQNIKCLIWRWPLYSLHQTYKISNVWFGGDFTPNIQNIKCLIWRWPLYSLHQTYKISNVWFGGDLYTLYTKHTKYQMSDLEVTFMLFTPNIQNIKCLIWRWPVYSLHQTYKISNVWFGGDLYTLYTKHTKYQMSDLEVTFILFTPNIHLCLKYNTNYNNMNLKLFFL